MREERRGEERKMEVERLEWLEVERLGEEEWRLVRALWKVKNR